jgi:hypothetical protein
VPQVDDEPQRIAETTTPRGRRLASRFEGLEVVALIPLAILGGVIAIVLVFVGFFLIDALITWGLEAVGAAIGDALESVGLRDAGERVALGGFGLVLLIVATVVALAALRPGPTDQRIAAGGLAVGLGAIAVLVLGSAVAPDRQPAGQELLLRLFLGAMGLLMLVLGISHSRDAWRARRRLSALGWTAMALVGPLLLALAVGIRVT